MAKHLFASTVKVVRFAHDSVVVQSMYPNTRAIAASRLGGSTTLRGAEVLNLYAGLPGVERSTNDLFLLADDYVAESGLS